MEEGNLTTMMMMVAAEILSQLGAGISIITEVLNVEKKGCRSRVSSFDSSGLGLILIELFDGQWHQTICHPLKSPMTDLSSSLIRSLLHFSSHIAKLIVYI